VLIKNPDPTHSHYTGDGIDLNAAALSALTLQNLWIEGVDDAANGAVIHIDHLTGSTDYQGMQASYDIGTPPEERRLSQRQHRRAAQPPRSLRGEQRPLCLVAHRWGRRVSGPREPSGSLASNAVWANPANNHDCSATYRNGMVTWPAVTDISGGIHNGLPPGGDFVAAGVAGINYVSPGY